MSFLIMFLNQTKDFFYRNKMIFFALLIVLYRTNLDFLIGILAILGLLFILCFFIREFILAVKDKRVRSAVIIFIIFFITLSSVAYVYWEAIYFEYVSNYKLVSLPYQGILTPFNVFIPNLVTLFEMREHAQR